MNGLYADKYIKGTERIFPEQGREAFLRLDMNENEKGLPKDFVDSVLKKITPSFLSQYPEPEKFRNEYAAFLGFKSENIMLGNGTDAILRYLFETFGEEGKDVLTVSPSFEMYRINCLLLGLNHKAVSYEKEVQKNGDEKFFVPIDKICDSIDKDTRIVVITNPNNPMTDAYEKADFERILKKAKENNALLICDEAYHYFCDGTMIDFVRSYDNLVITRTFSKLMSIPALRLGAAIGNEAIIKTARQSQLSFDVNSIALLFGEELIKRRDIIDDLIEKEREGRAYITDTLREKGYPVICGDSNYVLIKTKKKPKDIERMLKGKKILIHTYGESSVIKDYIRVTTGDKEAMEKFVVTFLEMED